MAFAVVPATQGCGLERRMSGRSLCLGGGLNLLARSHLDCHHIDTRGRTFDILCHICRQDKKSEKSNHGSIDETTCGGFC